MKKKEWKVYKQVLCISMQLLAEIGVFGYRNCIADEKDTLFYHILLFVYWLESYFTKLDFIKHMLKETDFV